MLTPSFDIFATARGRSPNEAGDPVDRLLPIGSKFEHMAKQIRHLLLSRHRVEPDNPRRDG